MFRTSNLQVFVWICSLSDFIGSKYFALYYFHSKHPILESNNDIKLNK